MELRHLRYFIALSHTLNFTRAAELVHVTQSTLSHQIAQLEQELEIALVARHPKGLQLTPEGETFLLQARRALDAVDAGVRALRSPARSEAAPVRIGATTSLAAAFVAPAIATLLAPPRRASMVLLDMTPGDIVNALRRGEIDLGVAYPPVDLDGLASERMFVEELVVTVSARHELARRRRIQLADLHGRELILPTHRFSIRHLVDECFKSAGAEPVIVAEVDSFQATLTLLQELGAAALFPARAAPTGPWSSIPVERPFANRAVTLYRRAGETLRAEVKPFREALRAAARSA